MIKKGFVLKQTLIVFSFLCVFLLSMIQIISNNVQSLKNTIILEKQKAVEIIIASYFNMYYDSNEIIEIELENFTLNYECVKQENLSKLTSRVCFDSCYEIEGVYDDQKNYITSWRYKGK